MLPKHYQLAIAKIKALERYPEYLGAFVFGSAARGKVTNDSDLDVKVVIAGNNSCDFINHPRLNGIKLDLSFNSLRDLAKQDAHAQKKGFRPMISESIIIFDKKGVLKSLKKKALKVKPSKLKVSEYPAEQFQLFHANNKVERNIERDPDSAMLSMHAGINTVLHLYCEIRGQWWVSNKRMLDEMKTWDPAMRKLLVSFLRAMDVIVKYKAWQKIVRYVGDSMGGIMEIDDIVCDCKTCQRDLARLNS